MKRHKMTIDITLEMPDDMKVSEARKQVTSLLSDCKGVGCVAVTRFSGARPWERKDRNVDAAIPCVVMAPPK